MLVALLAAATASIVTVPPPGKPPAIPAVREWHRAPGGFELRGTSRVVFRDARLAADAALFARELRRPAVAGVPAGPGDIELALGSPDRRLGREGYTLDVGQSVHIGARTRAGVFCGTRTVLQRLNARGRVQGGHARDWPSYPERGLMLDNGRPTSRRPGSSARSACSRTSSSTSCTCISPTTRAFGSRARATRRSSRTPT